MNPTHQCSRAAMVAAAAFFCYATSPALAQSDSFATATPIVSLPVTGTNAGATKETGEANHGNNAGGSSVWFSWTATATGYYRVDLAGSSYDTELGIYTGTSVDTTVLLAQNDDSGATGGALQSAAVVYVQTGETILIAVDGYKGTAVTPATGSIKLDIIPLTPTQVPPANDLFSAAASLGSANAGTVNSNNSYGTREVGEPRIGALAGGSSLWWKWTAPADGDMEFSLAGATAAGAAFNTGIGVYTGTALTNLTPVASSGPATTNAVQVSVTAGTVYYIAGDASSAAFIQPVGTFTLRFAKTYIHTIFPYGVAWDWLHPAGSDPVLTDADFNTTWFSAALYDGPAFNLQGTAMLGYGGIDFGTTVTNIVDPGTGSRYSAYFRRVFTMPEAATDIIASILADDGAFIYIDGILVKEVNMPLGSTDTYTQLASAASSETVPVKVSLGPLTAGPHEIAVSVHNAATSSSDLGFALSLQVDNTPPPTDAVLTAAGLYTGFEEPVISAVSYLKGANGTAELGWTATAGQVQSAATHPAAGGTAPAGQFFKLNAVRTSPFRTDRISLASLTAEQKAGIVASAKVRTFTTSGTTFETADDLVISLESSIDGTTFTKAADILPLTTGGDTTLGTPDNLIVISQATGDYVTFTTTAGTVPADANFVRVSFTGGDDSTSEFIYIDDIRVDLSSSNPLADTDGDGQSDASEAFAGTDPNDTASVLKITGLTVDSVSPTPKVTATFPGIAGKTYKVEYSDDLVTWAVLQDNISSVTSAPVVQAGLTLPAGGRGFLRVSVKP